MIKTITLSEVQRSHANTIAAKQKRIDELTKESAELQTVFISLVLDKEGITDNPVDVKVIDGQLIATFADKVNG